MDGQVTFAHARLEQGFIAPQFHLAVIPDHRLLRRRREAPRPVRGRRGILRSFTDLRTGDIVVPRIASIMSLKLQRLASA